MRRAVGYSRSCGGADTGRRRFSLAVQTDSRGGHFNRADAGQDLPQLMAVAHHQPVAVAVRSAGERRDAGVYPGLLRPASICRGALPHGFTGQRRRARRRAVVVGVVASHYGKHRVVPSRPGVNVSHCLRPLLDQREPSRPVDRFEALPLPWR
jgi:hypothetical protein